VVRRRIAARGTRTAGVGPGRDPVSRGRAAAEDPGERAPAVGSAGRPMNRPIGAVPCRTTTATGRVPARTIDPVRARATKLSAVSTNVRGTALPTVPPARDPAPAIRDRSATTVIDPDLRERCRPDR
jgi:hypothetical protein